MTPKPAEVVPRGLKDKEPHIRLIRRLGRGPTGQARGDTGVDPAWPAIPTSGFSKRPSTHWSRSMPIDASVAAGDPGKPASQSWARMGVEQFTM